MAVVVVVMVVVVVVVVVAAVGFYPMARVACRPITRAGFDPIT